MGLREAVESVADSIELDVKAIPGDGQSIALLQEFRNQLIGYVRQLRVALLASDEDADKAAADVMADRLRVSGDEQTESP